MFLLEVMPAPHGPIYPGRDPGKTEWQCVLILGVTHGKEYFLRTSAITDGYPWRDPCQWSEAEPARSVTRVAIRCIALLAFFTVQIVPSEQVYRFGTSQSYLSRRR
jgi:hypothetical protein